MKRRPLIVRVCGRGLAEAEAQDEAVACLSAWGAHRWALATGGRRDRAHRRAGAAMAKAWDEKLQRAEDRQRVQRQQQQGTPRPRSRSRRPWPRGGSK